jgi:hypothetical protein
MPEIERTAKSVANTVRVRAPRSTAADLAPRLPDPDSRAEMDDLVVRAGTVARLSDGGEAACSAHLVCDDCGVVGEEHRAGCARGRGAVDS